MAGNDLVIPIGGDPAQLERAMKKAADSADRAAASIEKRFDRLDLASRFGVGAIQGAIAAISVDRLIRGFADANKEIAGMAETAKRTGIDLGRLQELRMAGQSQGLTGKQVDTGLEGLAEKLNEARGEETELGKLFDANNIKLKDRSGNVIGTNQALEQAANLVQRAATEFDKIKIAEILGLTRDWVPLLEKGADGLNRMANEARLAGGVIDSATIEKAKEFEERWSAAVAAWSTMFKSNIGGIIDMLNGLVGIAGKLGAGLADYAKRTAAVSDIELNGVNGASRGSLEWAINKGRELGVSEQDLADAKGRLDELRELDREATRGRRSQPLDVTVRPTGRSTVIPPKSSGGGSGESEEDKRYDQVQRYIEQLEKTSRVLEAEKATLGLSNAERAKAIELARIGTVTDEGQKAKIEEIVGKNEELRASIARVKQSQDGLRDAQKFFGDAAVDALEDLIVNGAKAEDVVKRLAASLVKAALQAALLGQGTLGGLFGTAGTNGNLGGLIGGLFGGFRAGGGSVSAGKAYVVGEKRPELFVPSTSGRIVPNVPTVSPVAAGGGNLIVNVQNNTPAQVETKPRSDGGVDMVINQVEGALAQRLLRGQGSLSQALTAKSTNRHLQG